MSLINIDLDRKGYTFYYDESEHSRKINQKTISASNYSNNFISVIIGHSNNHKGNIEERFTSYRDKYKSRLVRNEFKSTSLKLNNGFSSINKHNMAFINDFLDMIEADILVYFSVINKIEYVTNQIFNNYQNTLLINMDNVRYSISKAVSLYKPQNVIHAMYNEGDIIEELKIFFRERIEKNNSNMVLKKRENLMFHNLILILDDYNKDFNIDWEYRISFDGFKKYLLDKKIKNYQLILDKEGHVNEDSLTLIAAKNIGIINVIEDDSKNHIGIQIADLLAGIISKMIKMIDESLSYKNINEATSKKLLPKEWFEINENQFALYKKMSRIVTQLNNSWYKSYSGVYADGLIQFISLLNYFDSYEDWGKYQKISLATHAEKYNTLAINKLEKHFDTISFKLPIEPLVEENGIYYNQKGAKCYSDWRRHEFLEIPKTESGKVYDVLSAGFFGRLEQPNITIEVNNQAECYLLPSELFNWTVNCVGLANLGENVLPSKVRFSIINNQYDAEILSNY